VPWLTPIDNNTLWSFNPNPPVVTGTATGRNIPDLAMNADPQTGYAVYSTMFYPIRHTDWEQVGGTSFVAPQLAGITALINEDVGGRVGFWNPQIYRFATTPASPFRPLDATGVMNDNLYYTGTSGAIYNPGSGLGTPNVALLAQDFKNPPGV
jgi:subtilase family serine protease